MTDYARTMTGWMDGPFLGWDQKSDDELTQTGFRRPLGVRWPPESITTFSSPAAGCRPPDIIGSPKCSSAGRRKRETLIRCFFPASVW